MRVPQRDGAARSSTGRAAGQRSSPGKIPRCGRPAPAPQGGPAGGAPDGPSPGDPEPFCGAGGSIPGSGWSFSSTAGLRPPQDPHPGKAAPSKPRRGSPGGPRRPRYRPLDGIASNVRITVAGGSLGGDFDKCRARGPETCRTLLKVGLQSRPAAATRTRCPPSISHG